MWKICIAPFSSWISLNLTMNLPPLVSFTLLWLWSPSFPSQSWGSPSQDMGDVTISEAVPQFFFPHLHKALSDKKQALRTLQVLPEHVHWAFALPYMSIWHSAISWMYFQSSSWTSLSLAFALKFLVSLLFVLSVIPCLRHDVKQLFLIISNKSQQAKSLFLLADLWVGLSKKEPSENRKHPVMTGCLFPGCLAASFVKEGFCCQDYHAAGRQERDQGKLKGHMITAPTQPQLLFAWINSPQIDGDL